MPLDGVLILNKPEGITSRQAVARLASLAGALKAGHAGTLDPLATGVLVVCMGRATLLTGYLAAGTKEYVTDALLGVQTDTYDVQGRVTAEIDASGVTSRQVIEALGRFEGKIAQVPPPFSAVKYNGKPLYHYARRGVPVEARQRTVTVESVSLEGMEDSDRGRVATLRIVCGPGTYVRSLVHDLGGELGCGACVSSLVRTRSGPYALEGAETLEELEGVGAEGIAARALPLEAATCEMPTLALDGERAVAVTMGKPILQGAAEVPAEGVVFRVLDGSGRLIALYGPPRPDDEGIVARAVRVVRPHNEASTDEAA